LEASLALTRAVIARSPQGDEAIQISAIAIWIAPWSLSSAGPFGPDPSGCNDETPRVKTAS
jgi:hypothetical protein